MNAERLLQLYDRVSDAPDAIPQLRRFVLDLALRGKLVEQDPQDEPSSDLLKHVAIEKEQLFRQGTIQPRKIKIRDRNEPLEFQKPPGWEISDLGRISIKITDGAHKTPTYVERGIPFVSVKDFSGGNLDLSNTRRIPESEHESLYRRCDPRRGDILIGRIGTLGKAVLVDTDVEFSLFVSVGLIRFSAKYFYPKFLRLTLNSPFVASEFDRIKIGGGTHTNKLNLGDLHGVAIPVPPLAEQHRIVAKVDELMDLLDRMETDRAQRETIRNKLTTASLSRLTVRETNAETFKAHANFAIRVLPELTTRPDQIKVLRQTILDLAVRGKLVEQDPDDEAVSVLLQRIEAERNDLVGKGIIRRERPLPSIASKVTPFELPQRWLWVRIGEVALFTQYGTSRKAQRTADGVPVLTMGNIQDGAIGFEVAKQIPKGSEELPALYLKHGDLLYNRTNSAELVGKTGIYLGKDDSRTFASYLIRICLSKHNSLSRYVNLAMNAPFFRSTQIVPLIKQQTGQANVNGTFLKNMLVPLPPLREQYRIIDAVDRLMSLCDRLSESLVFGQDIKSRLLETLLLEALEPSYPSNVVRTGT